MFRRCAAPFFQAPAASSDARRSHSFDSPDHPEYNAQRARSAYIGLPGTRDHKASWRAPFCGQKVRK